MLKNILSILAGSVGAQLIALIAAPVITRLYLPEDFGAMTTVWAVISVFGVVACLAYEKTVVLEKQDTVAQCLVTICIYLSLFTATVISAVVYLLDVFIITDFFSVGYVALFIFVGVFVFGLRKALDFYATREQLFKLIAISMLFGSLIGVSWKIIAGMVWITSGELLLIGNIIGIIVPALILYGAVKIYKPQQKDQGGVIDGLILLKRYAEFPKKQVPNALLNSLQLQAPVFILGGYFDSQIVGFYGLALAVLLRPVRALAEAVSRVYLQRVTKLRQKDLHRDLFKITVRLGIVAAPFCIFLLFYGESLFNMLFGREWGEAGRMASLMAPWVFTVVLKVPTTQTLFVQQALSFILYFNVVNLVLRVSGLVVTIYITRDAYVAILVFSIIGFIGNAFYVTRGLIMAGNR